MTLNLLMSDLAWGGFTLILGMLVIFLGMAVIIICVTLMGKVISSKKEEKKVEAPSTVQAEPQPVVEDGIPEDVRVAIIAAIAAYYDGNQPQQKAEFTVRKIKKLR